MSEESDSELIELEDTELPALTPKRLKFVQGIAEGKTQTQAYRDAYNCANMQNKTIWANASRLAADSNVKAWIRLVELQAAKQVATTVAYTKEQHLAELTQLQHEARQAGQYSAAINATVSKGKAAGHYIDYKEVTYNNKTDTELLNQLRQLLGEQAAAEAARKLGYTVPETPTESLTEQSNTLGNA